MLIQKVNLYSLFLDTVSGVFLLATISCNYITCSRVSFRVRSHIFKYIDSFLRYFPRNRTGGHFWQFEKEFWPNTCLNLWLSCVRKCFHLYTVKLDLFRKLFSFFTILYFPRSQNSKCSRKFSRQHTHTQVHTLTSTHTHALTHVTRFIL